MSPVSCVAAASADVDLVSFAEYVPKKPVKVGHVARPDMPVQYIKVSLSLSHRHLAMSLILAIFQSELDKVRGHLVSMPLDFLSKGTQILSSRA